MRKELSTMLDWQVTQKGNNWQNKMDYMEIGNRDDRRYRDRAILVRPSKYIYCNWVSDVPHFYRCW